MRMTSKRAAVLYALVALFLVGVLILAGSIVVNADTWALKNVNQHLFTNGELANCGTIYDRNDKVLARTVDGKRVYSEDSAVRKATLHLLGDPAGVINGIHSAYKSQLVGYNLINGVYHTQGSTLGGNVLLTIDSDLCAAALKALGSNKGTVGVYNYKTGEILCMVSSPTYDINNKPDHLDTDGSGKYDGVYMNRFLSGLYTPGSTFKVITAAAAIENIPDIESQTFNCTGELKTQNGVVKCNGRHGKVDFEKALNESCNATFADIAIQVGNEKMTQVAARLGFKTSVESKYRFQMDRFNIAPSRFDVSAANDLDLGWAGIGQYSLLVNPYHEMMLMGAIANGGTPVLPYAVRGVATYMGIMTDKGSAKTGDAFFTPETAGKLSDLMRSDVVNKYGDGKFKNMELCGKTGTAEVSDEGKKPHAWFVGFSRNPDFPVAFVVVAENGGSGGSVAVPIAQKVLRAAYDSMVPAK